VRKPAALARFRIAAQALYRLRARPVTAVLSELTLWNRGVARSEDPRRQCTRLGSARAGDALAFREPPGDNLKKIVEDHSRACDEIKENLAAHKESTTQPREY
jgi:hypothetical protein